MGEQHFCTPLLSVRLHFAMLHTGGYATRCGNTLNTHCSDYEWREFTMGFFGQSQTKGNLGNKNLVLAVSRNESARNV